MERVGLYALLFILVVKCATYSYTKSQNSTVAKGVGYNTDSQHLGRYVENVLSQKYHEKQRRHIYRLVVWNRGSKVSFL